MRRTLTIALIIAITTLALMSYHVALPLWRGCGFGLAKRHFAIPGTAGKLRVDESWSKARLYFGSGHIDVPLSSSLVLLTLSTLAASLVGFAPEHRPVVKPLGFSILALVFALLAVLLAADTGEVVGFLLEPQFANKHLVYARAWQPPVLLPLTTVVTIISWLASFRLCKKFVHNDFVT